MCLKLKPNLILFILISILLFLVSSCSGEAEYSPITSLSETNQDLPKNSSSPPSTIIFTPTATPTYSQTPVPIIGMIDRMISERDGMDMVYIPEGEFAMGADSSIGFSACKDLFEPFASPLDCGEGIPFGVEEPVHSVWLDGYWMDKTEVTNAMFVALLNKVGNKIEWGEPWYNTSDPDAQIHEIEGTWVVEEGFENHPVSLVTWHGAHSYCERVGRRLPSEAEWEKAARGTDQRIYPWGNEFDGTNLNFCDQNCWDSPNIYYNDGFVTTAPVGSYPQGASPYGVLDMAGNVYEWVFDRFGRNYYENSPYKNPDGPAESLGDIRGLRGGSWFSTGDITRTTSRYSRIPSFTWTATGFRCVMSE